MLPSMEEDPDWNRHVVMITHDETTFYANYGVATPWMEPGTDKIKRKSVGSSIMVSGFVCECHGFMKDELGKSYQLFYAYGMTLKCDPCRDGRHLRFQQFFLHNPMLCITLLIAAARFFGTTGVVT